MKKSKITLAMLIALMAMAFFVFTGCPSSEEEEEPPPGPGPEDYIASGSFTSETGGTVETTSGASIIVPVGAVPRTTSGETGTMVFSIERDTEWELTAPAGYTIVSDLYRFGPSGFTLGEPVQLAIPVAESYGAGEVTVYRIDYNTEEYIPTGGVYDEETGTVTVQTYDLSRWFIMAPNSREPTDWGCVHFDNNSSVWIGVCVTMYTLEYPEIDEQYMDEDLSCYMSPSGHMGGVTSYVNWRIPQGNYQICVQTHLNDGSEFFYGNYLDTLIVENPFNLSYPTCNQRSIGGTWPPIPPDTGMCACTPIPTSSVGTGAIQVTLTWRNHNPIDLDLFLIEPDSTYCAYWNKMTVNGDTLDRDNRCGNYLDGRPENIYSTRPPLAGEYIVQVDWYSDCSSGMTSQNFDVRVVVNGQAQTYNGTITPNPRTIEVTRFTVGPTVMFGPYTGIPVDTRGLSRPEKMGG